VTRRRLWVVGLRSRLRSRATGVARPERVRIGVSAFGPTALPRLSVVGLRLRPGWHVHGGIVAASRRVGVWPRDPAAASGEKEIIIGHGGLSSGMQ
jgi:hypothetical protein